jgi:hypothetical protein
MKVNTEPEKSPMLNIMPIVPSLVPNASKIKRGPIEYKLKDS